MIFKSPYPEVPALPEGNVHDFCFNRPDQAAWPDFTLYIDAETERETKFSEFKHRIKLGAAALGASPQEGGLGLNARDGHLVGIMGLNSVNHISLYHSLLYLAVPSALISAYSTPFELNHALTLTKLTHLFVDASLLPLVKPVAQRAGIRADRIYILSGACEGHKSLDELIQNVVSKGLPIPPVRPATKDTLAYLLPSSGTTGLPKAVMLSHSNIQFAMAQVMTVGMYMMKVAPPPSPPPRALQLAYLPMHHTYGLHQYSIAPCIGPATFVLMKKWNIDLALKCFRKYKITVAPLVPSIAHQLVNHPDLKEADFSHITTVMCGAAHMPRDLANKLKKFIPSTANIAEGYGMTESSVSTISQPPVAILDGWRVRASGSVGVLSPGIEAKLIRDDGTEAGFDEEGEYFVRGASVTLGYYNNEKATREIFLEDGWLRTGDRLRVNKEGHWFFVDRVKDTLKVSGAQVSPAEIEEVLLANPRKLIIDATVAGVSGGRTRDEKVPRAWIVLSEEGRNLGRPQTIKELEAWTKESLSKYKWLRGGIEIIDEIPKSPTGKVLKRILVDRFEEKVEKEHTASML